MWRTFVKFEEYIECVQQTSTCMLIFLELYSREIQILHTVRFIDIAVLN